MAKRRDVFIFSAVNDNEDAVILLFDDRRDIDIYWEIARDEVTEINVIDVEVELEHHSIEMENLNFLIVI